MSDQLGITCDKQMKYETEKLAGLELDYAVATITGCLRMMPGDKRHQLGSYSPSTRWDHGGPIIESERISIEFYGSHWGAMPKDANGCEVPDPDPEKHKEMSGGWCPVMAVGDSPLVAALRAFVRARIGDEVEL